MAQIYVENDQWSKRRQRAVELRERWPFAGEVLGFYTALLDVQQIAYQQAQRDKPEARSVAAYVSEHIVPRVVEVSVASGPPALMAAVLADFHEASSTEIIERWLCDAELTPPERYLARASAGPVLEALGSAADAACRGARDEQHCPVCGGLPQVSFLAVSTEDLVTAHRYLECSRCAATWPYPRMACATCGETETSKLSIYSEIGAAQVELSGEVIKSATTRPPIDASIVFSHMRIDGCQTCSHYLLTVNVERDGKAVPVVDELAAIPLVLYANEHGLTKTVSNLMGL